MISRTDPVIFNENGFYCFSSEDVFSCRATSDDDSPCLIGRIDYTLSNVYVRILWKTVWLFHFILVPLHHLPVKGRMISPLRWRVSGQLVWHIVGKNREAHASSCSLEPEKFQLDTRWCIAALTLWRGIVVSLYLCLIGNLRTAVERCRVAMILRFFCVSINVRESCPTEFQNRLLYFTNN